MDKYWIKLVANTVTEVTPAQPTLGWSLENSFSFPFGMEQKIAGLEGILGVICGIQSCHKQIPPKVRFCQTGNILPSVFPQDICPDWAKEYRYQEKKKTDFFIILHLYASTSSGMFKSWSELAVKLKFWDPCTGVLCSKQLLHPQYTHRERNPEFFVFHSQEIHRQAIKSFSWAQTGKKTPNYQFLAHFSCINCTLNAKNIHIQWLHFQKLWVNFQFRMIFQLEMSMSQDLYNCLKVKQINCNDFK